MSNNLGLRPSVRPFVLALLLAKATLFAAVTRSISGVIKDPSGSVIPGVMVTVTNTAQGIETKATTDAKGVYTFPSLAVGSYELKTDIQGFKPQTKKNLAVDVDSALQIDLTLELAQKVE